MACSFQILCFFILPYVLSLLSPDVIVLKAPARSHDARSIIAWEIYHCGDKLHRRKEINFVQKLNCRGVSTKAILLMSPPHKHKPGIYTPLRKLLKPVFSNPSINELLSTCLHGKTQNNNKSLNSIISKRRPKDVGRTTLSMGVSSVVIHFNNGTHGL